MQTTHEACVGTDAPAPAPTHSILFPHHFRRQSRVGTGTAASMPRTPNSPTSRSSIDGAGQAETDPLVPHITHTHTRHSSFSGPVGVGVGVGVGDVLRSTRTRTRTRTRPKSAHFAAPPLPGTRNELTPEERREQLRRTQKLARVLGEEVLGGGGGSGRDAARLQRRRSDPPLIAMAVPPPTTPTSPSLSMRRSHSAEGTTLTLDAAAAAAARTREERRRRVAKMSRWLGAVVPPTLVAPHPAAPDEPYARVAEDAPQLGTGTGLSKVAARAASLGRKGRTGGVGTEEPPLSQADRGLVSTRSAGELAGTGGATSGRERFAHVKRASKLERVFGAAPPHALFTPAGGGGAPPLPPPSPPLQIISRQTLSARNDDARLDADSSSTYRHSIDSLEYLLANDVPLLNEVLDALDEDDNDEDDVGPTSNPFLEHPRASDDADAAPRTSLASLESLPSPTTESEGSSSSNNNGGGGGGEHYARRHRAMRAQKLGRFFGERLPSDGGAGGAAAAVRDYTPRRPAAVASFGRVIASLEQEAMEDERLGVRQREDIRLRLEALRRRIKGGV